MIFSSKSEVLHKILNINKQCQFINVIAPKYSGKSQFIEEIKSEINLKSKTLTFVQTSENYLNNEIVENLVKSINVEYGIDIEVSQNDTSLYDILFNIFKRIDYNDLDSMYFIIDDIDKIGADRTYNLLSQLRNLREKISSDKISFSLIIICVGSWRPSELRKKCEFNVGSYFPEEIFLSDYDEKEVKSFIIKYRADSFTFAIEDYKIKYLYEISGGCFGIIDYVLKNIGDDFTCNNIREKAYNLINEKFFKDYIEKTLSKLSKYSLDVINNLLCYKIVRYRNKEIELFEELLLSGIVKKVKMLDIEVLAMRSWIHEITIREHKAMKDLLGNNKTLKDYNELIPPIPSLNQFAYEIVLEIENRLRNYLVIILNEKTDNSENPFKVVDALGKFNDDWKKHTLGEELQFQKDKLKNRHSEFVDAYSSSSSSLLYSDLIYLLLNSIDKNGINLYNTSFQNNSETKDMFDRFRIIRNQIAHNNIITEKTIDELNKIKKAIIKILSY